MFGLSVNRLSLKVWNLVQFLQQYTVLNLAQSLAMHQLGLSRDYTSSVMNLTCARPPYVRTNL